MIKVSENDHGWIGSTTLYRNGDRFVLVCSYETYTKIKDTKVKGTIAYETDTNGSVIKNVPLLVEDRIVQHDKFVRNIK